MAEARCTMEAWSWSQVGPNEPRDNDEDGYVSPHTVVHSRVQPSPACSVPLQQTWSTSLPPDSYERASGAPQKVEAVTLEAITDQFDMQSLEDVDAPPPSGHASDAASSSAMSPLPTVDNSSPVAYQPPASQMGSRPRTTISMSSSTKLSTPLPMVRPDLPRYRPSEKSHRKKLGKIKPSTAQLVQKMICSGDQCQVQAIPVAQTGPPSVDKTAAPTLEVDHIMTDDFDAEKPNVQHFLDSRRAGRPSGINRNGSLAHRSSVDNALGNRNYVFKVPRMRKRVGKKVSPQVTDCTL